MVNKNKKNIYLSGFSLFEACVVMLIVAVFIAMCANAYTKRHVTYQESDGHGRYECYYKGGQLVQRYVENNSARSNVGGTTCVFRPPRYAKYLLGQTGKYYRFFGTCRPPCLDHRQRPPFDPEKVATTQSSRQWNLA